MQVPIQVEIRDFLSDAACAREITNLQHSFAPSALRIFRQWRAFLQVIAFLCCLGRASVALAQGPTWASIGPEGGPTFALAIDPVTPTTLYAGTYSGGAFKSTNGGDSWTAINNGLPPRTAVFALAVDPVTPTTLYAATNYGVFKSTNGGDCWTAINNSRATFGTSTTKGILVPDVLSSEP